MSKLCIALGIILAFTALTGADEPTPAQRGRKALETRALNMATWKTSTYDDAWKEWGTEKKQPADYAQAFMAHYGMHPAPYENGRYPMGLREGRKLLGKGLTTDCLICHGGSIAGKSYIGLGNSTLDFQAFYEDFSKANGSSGKTPITFSNARGTSEAASMAVYLLSHRDADLNLLIRPLNLDVRDDMCEDVPAWWLLKKKKTMYYTGSTDARSIRSLMQFMLVPFNVQSTFEKEEPTFADIQAYILSLEPPKYPFPIDKQLAAKGEALFGENCSKCHGTYGTKWTYPNKIVPIDTIGTDRKRFDGISPKVAEHYNKTWLGREKGLKDYGEPVGYQAPPLDGIWATAPYFHNGSAPTVYHVLNSKARPKIFTRSFRTDVKDYDQEKLGWKIEVLPRGPDPKLPAYEQRKVYDTTQPGRSNGGHTFGDHLDDGQRRAVIEYLKTL